MTNDDLLELLRAPAEQRGVEFKGPGKRDDSYFFAIVTRAVLAMANRRDGGVVILGIGDDRGVFTPVGLSEEERTTWQGDAVLDKLAEYADPSVDVSIVQLVWDGKCFVALEVREFEDLPVACKKDYSGVLRRGAFYGRSRRKPESLEVGSQADMRDLIELATEKRLRQLLRITAGAGAVVTSSEPWQSLDAVAGDVAAKIRTRGYWSVDVRPGGSAGIIFPDIHELEAAVTGAEVRFYGWRFPRLYTDVAIERHPGHIEQQTEAREFLEAWRLYDTGQFQWLGGYHSDWRDQESFRDRPLSRDWQWGRAIGVAEALSYCTLAIEFAARLGASGRFTEAMSVAISFERLRDRELVMDITNRAGFSMPRIATTERFEWHSSIDVADLLGHEAEVTATIARRLLALFRWDADEAWCRRIIDDLRASR